jgi:hypothetical protein
LRARDACHCLLKKSTRQLPVLVFQFHDKENAVFLDDNLISWSPKRQPTVSRSNVEAEYRAVADGVAETCWLRQLLLELNSPLRGATVVYCDNVGVVYLSTNPFSISEPSILRLIYTSSGSESPSVKFTFCTFPLRPSTPTSSRKVCRRPSSQSYV